MEKSVSKQKLQRTDAIINKQFIGFLIPAILGNVAVLLNEFADSLVVSNLLGSEALCIVNLGSPIVILFAAVSSLFGMGGAVLYAKHIGKMEKAKAGSILASTLRCSMIVGVVFMVTGLVFINPLTPIFCSEPTLQSVFNPYLKVLFLSTVPMVMVQVLCQFLPAAGSPKLATLILLIANCVNIFCDIVYIRLFGMDVCGAAWATFTGYVTGMIVLILCILTKRCKLTLSKVTKESMRSLPSALGTGLPSASTQLGFSVKISFCNFLASLVAGKAGITAFSCCMQTISIVSIVMGGIATAMVPLLTMMNVQKDYAGIRLLEKRVIKLQLIVNMVVTFVLFAFPEIIAKMYAIKEPDAYNLTLEAVRIFSLIFILRGFVQVAQYTYVALGRVLYALVISMLDGAAGIIPISIIMVSACGITGLWLSFPVCAAVIIAGVLLFNNSYRKKLDYDADIFLLTRKNVSRQEFLSISFERRDCNPSAIAEQIQEFLQKTDLKAHTANIIAVACEEVYGFTLENSREDNFCMDIRVVKEEEDYTLYFKSSGNALDVVEMSREEQYGNIWMLKKITGSIAYDYVMGANQTVCKF